MVFSLSATANSTVEIQAANNYASIRLLTVGQKTSSLSPLLDLATLEQPWSVASNVSVSNGVEFGYFSSVCFFFARNLVDELGANAPPIGLVSSNWGGTKIESWMTQKAITPCNGSAPANLFNAMIFPFTVGPMAVTGFTWCESSPEPPCAPRQSRWEPPRALTACLELTLDAPLNALLTEQIRARAT